MRKRDGKIRQTEVLSLQRLETTESTGGWASVTRSDAFSWVVLAVPLIIVLIGAWNYRWVQEDAFINFRIISNLLAGHGPVFNIGERVEVYSDPLWMFLLAGMHEVLPFINLEWLSVLLGLAGTASGVLLGGRAIQRLGGSRGDTPVLPIGLLIFSVVAGVWEFSTSGLEMGMVFAWIGLSFWLLVRTEERRTTALWCAFIVGLGTLIRPELILMSLVFLSALTLVAAAPNWQGPTGPFRRYVLPLLVALGLPVLYELWRMAYFGMLVANTALAKSAGNGWWSQGLYYLWNFVQPYALWLPLLIVLPLIVPRVSRWWGAGDRLGVALLLTPAAAGLVDTLYVVHLGGDYMHARLLLPAFLALSLAVYVDLDQLRTIGRWLVVGVLLWCIICAGWLRFSPIPTQPVHFIDNERSLWIFETGRAHPITAADYGRFTLLADILTRGSRRDSSRAQAMLILDNPEIAFFPDQVQEVGDTIKDEQRPARSALPFQLVVNTGNIGSVAYASGPQIYFFDSYSLANPIGSHTSVLTRGRPGHEKFIGPAWMVARFGIPGEELPKDAASPLLVSAARRALGCAPLSSYLHAITAPMSLSQAWSNITQSVTYTEISFSSDPIVAERQLCN